MLKMNWKRVLHLSMIYVFLGEEESEEQVTHVLVIRERKHEMTWTMLVPRKGTESELYAAVRTRQKFTTMRLVNPQRAGQGKSRRHAELVDTTSFQVKEVLHGQGGYEREPRRLDDATTTGTKDRAACENHGRRETFHGMRSV